MKRKILKNFEYNIKIDSSKAQPAGWFVEVREKLKENLNEMIEKGIT